MKKYIDDLKKIPKWKVISFVILSIVLMFASDFDIMPFIDSGNPDQGNPPTYGIEKSIDF